jgi:hypothetical protein
MEEGSMQEKYNQGFRYARFGVKSVGWVFGWLFVVIALVQIAGQLSPGVFGILVAGSIFWGFDTLWSALEDSTKMWKEIEKRRRGGCPKG